MQTADGRRLVKRTSRAGYKVFGPYDRETDLRRGVVGVTRPKSKAVLINATHPNQFLLVAAHEAVHVVQFTRAADKLKLALHGHTGLAKSAAAAVGASVRLKNPVKAASSALQRHHLRLEWEAFLTHSRIARDLGLPADVQLNRAGRAANPRSLQRDLAWLYPGQIKYGQAKVKNAAAQEGVVIAATSAVLGYEALSR